MITDSQKNLAYQIASAGLCKYSFIVSLIEKRDANVEQYKLAMQDINTQHSNVDTTSPDWWINRAYIFARTAEEAGAAKYDMAYFSFLRQGGPKIYKAKMGEIKRALLEQGKWYDSPESKEQIMPLWLKMLDEKPSYMQKRKEFCLEGN